jgi:hypothetical protein
MPQMKFRYVKAKNKQYKTSREPPQHPTHTDTKTSVIKKQKVERV